MQHFGKAVLRVTKNYTKGYSDTQSKLREATSNDPWGPSSAQMNDIAQMTFNMGDFVEIMEMLDKRLHDKGKNWRHVFKSLTVLDYCLRQGSENVVIYFRDNIDVVETLKEFQYIDENGRDQGYSVRQKAKDITNLLQDESRLRQERRMIRGTSDDPGEFDDEKGVDSGSNPPTNGLAGKRPNREEEDLRKAIEESKKSLAQDSVGSNTGHPGHTRVKTCRFWQKEGHDCTRPGHILRVQVLTAGLSAGARGYLRVCIEIFNIYRERIVGIVLNKTSY